MNCAHTFTGRDIALRCPRPRHSGRNECANAHATTFVAPPLWQLTSLIIARPSPPTILHFHDTSRAPISHIQFRKYENETIPFCPRAPHQRHRRLRRHQRSQRALLQRGLFEEEANRNLDAAISAYQSVITQTDKDHQFAATAIFRLGECYRKQGKTNEAAAQYQRILREFPDQADLAKLSRQQLGPRRQPW